MYNWLSRNLIRLKPGCCKEQILLCPRLMFFYHSSPEQKEDRADPGSFNTASPPSNTSEYPLCVSGGMCDQQQIFTALYQFGHFCKCRWVIRCPNQADDDYLFHPDLAPVFPGIGRTVTSHYECRIAIYGGWIHAGNIKKDPVIIIVRLNWV